jgi:hypothetical protein
MLRVGADPELFAVRKNGNPVSVIGKFPGTKEEPFEIEGVGALQVDNVACEFNTIPATSPDEFSNAVAMPLKAVEEFLAKKKLLLCEEAYLEFPQNQLNNADAVTAGCDPDYNAYNGMRNMPPDFYETNARSAAGHVHVGLDEIAEVDKPLLVKTLDLVLTIPALKFENADRRTLYGKAGCFRTKPYGLEYRTPSNFWVFTDARRKWVFECVQKAVEIFRDITLPRDLEDVINNNDLARAEMFIEQYDLVPCPVA